MIALVLVLKTAFQFFQQEGRESRVLDKEDKKVKIAKLV